ncbi:MAG: hypothetical protein ACK56I_14055, partial [bacterium]
NSLLRWNQTRSRVVSQCFMWIEALKHRSSPMLSIQESNPTSFQFSQLPQAHGQPSSPCRHLWV